MGVNELLLTMSVGGLSGCLASILFKRRSIGLKYDIMIGIVGALLTTHVLALLSLQVKSIIGSVAASSLGTIFLLLILSWLNNEMES